MASCTKFRTRWDPEPRFCGVPLSHSASCSGGAFCGPADSPDSPALSALRKDMLMASELMAQDASRMFTVRC